jgi:hypothetical protein
MEMKKCERGHYYDASVHTVCPYCNNVRNTEMTVAMGIPAPENNAAGGFYSNGGDLEKTVAMGVNMPQSVNQGTAEVDDEEKTVAMFQTSQGIDPVVGWLIRMNGKEKGQDYRIHSDNNFVGRSDKMDICIKGDETISRENQAVLTYDSTEQKFYFSPGEGRSVVRLNGKAILQTVELNAYDKVTLGKTELLFVPLCGDNFAWEEE